jgi:hypothetical protein
VTPAASAPDIVRLKNGGLVRGSISELVPGESVTVITLTGESRKFDMNEVSYAGSVANDPGAAEPAPPAAATNEAKPADKARPYVTVEATEARLHLVSDPPGLVFARQDASAFSGDRKATGYARLCAAPCDITLPAGTETISVTAETERHPYKIQVIRIPGGHSELRAYYRDNQSTRNRGWLIMGAGVVGGAALIALSIKLEESPPKPILLLGYATALAGIGVGIGFLLVRDDARFELVPGKSLVGGDKKATLFPALHGSF